VAVSLTGLALDQLLLLGLLSVLVELAVVCVTVAVDWGGVSNAVFVHGTWVVFVGVDLVDFQLVVHVLYDTLLIGNIGFTNWCHLSWNDASSLLLFGGSWLMRRSGVVCPCVSNHLAIIVDFNNLIRVILWFRLGRHRCCSSRLHKIIGLDSGVSALGLTIGPRWVLHGRRDHVAIVLINGVVLVAVRVDVDLI